MRYVSWVIVVVVSVGVAACGRRSAESGDRRPAEVQVASLSSAVSSEVERLDFSCSACDILMLTVDTLRADELSCGQTQETSPRLCALARQGVSFETAISPAPATIPAFSAVLTDTLISNEDAHEVLAHYEQAEYLAEKMTRLGYETAGFTDHPGFGDYERGRTTPVDFKRGFQVFRNLGDGNGKLLSSQLTDAVLAFLAERATVEKPLFLWVHHFGPHFDYTPSLEDARRFGYSEQRCGRITRALEFETLLKWRQTLTTEEIECLRALHKAEIFETDAQIGRLLDHIDTMPRAAKTLIVAFADHGEEFMERGELGHELTVFEELVHVPFLVRHPSRHRGQTVSQPTSTMLAHAAVLHSAEGRPVELDGQPVVTRTFHYYPSEDPNQMFRTTPNDFALRLGDFKHVWNPTKNEAQTFDLAADPGERAAIDGEREQQLHALLSAWHRSHRVTTSTPSEQAKQAQRELMQRLQKLGYIQPE